MMRRQARRGILLTVVVILLTLLGGLLTLLATHAADAYRERQALRVRLISGDIAQCAARYAQSHQAAWAAAPPDKPVELNITALLPTRFTGNAMLSVASANGRRVCHIIAETAWGAFASRKELDVTLDAR